MSAFGNRLCARTIKVLSLYVFDHNSHKSSDLDLEMNKLDVSELDTKGAEIKRKMDKLNTILVFNSRAGQSVGTVKYNSF